MNSLEITAAEARRLVYRNEASITLVQKFIDECNKNIYLSAYDGNDSITTELPSELEDISLRDQVRSYFHDLGYTTVPFVKSTGKNYLKILW